MIQNTLSKCNKHQNLLISFQKAKQTQESGYCSDCFFDNSKKYNCQQMHLTIIGIVQNELFEIQQKINNMNKNDSQSIEQLHDNVILLGQMKDGKKHGEYYYLFDDGTKEYAGIFEQNNKEGVWQEFVSFSYEVENYFQRQNKKKRMKTSIYNQGNKLIYKQITGQLFQSKYILRNLAISLIFLIYIFFSFKTLNHYYNIFGLIFFNTFIICQIEHKFTK